MKTSRLRLPFLFLALLFSLEARGAVRPFTPDAATLQLWHLDESAGATSAANAIAGGATLHAIGNGATLGGAGLAGFGKAASTFDGGPGATAAANPAGRDAYLAPLVLTNGTGDNSALAHDAADGAFTFEALVFVDFHPTAQAVSPDTSRAMQILSADADETRLMQFRVFWNSANDASPELQFINLAGATQTLSAVLPTTGANAIASGQWFHVAATYNGAQNTAGNLQLYWTKIEASRVRAERLASLQMTSDLPDTSADWAIGNEGRATGGTTDNWVGLIDEVRLSSIARGATEFVFWNPDDTDFDELSDTWERSFFGTLAQTATDDADYDGANNLDEYEAGSLPTNAASVPPQPLAKFVPVDDGDAATSEFGFAGASNINCTSFICSALQTVGNWQFLAYYGRHATNASYAFNNRIWLARRAVGAARWQVFRTNFTANDINDGHDVISFALDGEGVLHLSWGMHNDAFHYAKTTTPVTGGQPIIFGPDAGTMTGNEAVVTYPQFLTLPNGDVLYFFRKGNSATGGSGSGDNALNRYSLATHSWTNVHASGSTQLPFIKGIGWAPDYNAYLNLPCLDAAGNLFLTWTWRYTPDYQTNQDFAFAKSSDAGVTWRRSNGSAYSLPISRLAENGVENSRAQQILAIPQQSSLINQAGMCLDEQGQPVIATWWAPGTPVADFRRQYMVVFPGGGSTWETRQVSERTIDAAGAKKDAGAARDLGRPVVVCDRAGRLLVIYRDNDGTNGLTIAHSQPRAQDPQRLIWTQLELTADNLGNFEPVIDLARWQRDNVLQIIYQPSAGLGYAPPANNASPLGVLEWNAGAYFQPRPDLHLAFINARADIALSFTSQLGWGYRLFTSPDLVTWSALATFEGTGGLLAYTHVGGGLGGQRFWRIEVREGGFAP